MKTIDRIKDDLKSPWKWQTIGRDRIALLVEYYEAHQDLIAVRLLQAVFEKKGSTKGYKGIKDLRKAHKRLQQARARLEGKMDKVKSSKYCNTKIGFNSLLHPGPCLCKRSRIHRGRHRCGIAWNFGPSCMRTGNRRSNEK